MFAQPFVRPSFLQRRDPRLRLLLAAALAVALAPLHQPTSAALGLIPGIGLLLLARPPLRPLLHRLAAVNAFVLFLWLTTPWTTPGTTVWQWGFLNVTAEGLRLCLLVTLKSNAVVCAFLALIATMSPSELGYALERLRCPRKLVFLFLFTGRYVHLLADEWRTLMTAARLRGFRPRSTLHAYRTFASLLGLLLVRSHERARRTREAMLLRGFAGRFRSVARFSVGPLDIVFSLGLLLCLAGILWTEYAGTR